MKVMPGKWVTLIVIAFGLTARAPSVAAQASFERANEIYNAYWKDASQWKPTTDLKQRHARSQRASSLPGLLKDPLKQGVGDYLNSSPHPFPAELQLKLARALTPPSMHGEPVNDTAHVIASNNGDTFFVMYNVESCAICSSSWIGEFVREDGRFELRNELDDPLHGEMIHLALLRAPNGATAIAMYGLHWGDAHNRVDVRVFRVDDQFREVWSKRDMPQGTVEIQPDGFTLTYLSEPVRATTEIRETYRWNGEEVQSVARVGVAAPE